MNTTANPRAWGCSPAAAPASPRQWHVRSAVPRARVAATQTRAAAFRQLVLRASPGRRACLRLRPGNCHLHVIGTDRTWHRYRPPAPGAERGTEEAWQRAGSGFLSRRTWNDRPKGRCGRGSSRDHVIALLIVASLTGPSNFDATIGIEATGVDAAARPPVGLILGHDLASTPGCATDGSAPAC